MLADIIEVDLSTKNTKIPYENARNLLKHILSAYTTTVAAK